MTTAVMTTAVELLALERRVRRSGSGVDEAALVGCWHLDQVWPKGSERPSAFSGSLLRAVGARLEITSGEAGTGELTLFNVVSLGQLQLRFCGVGRLQGNRPLLQFSFQQLQLKIGGRLVLQQSLPQSAPQRLPFFALIGRDPSGWLAARGRGGGLALWRLGHS
jgi:hypothetical protein